jgi:hypothetical protein
LGSQTVFISERSDYKLGPWERAMAVALEVARSQGNVGDPAAEAAAQAAQLRDLFANPFRPVTIDAAWLR